MTDLIVRENALPASLEDLSKFVLIGRDKLQAVRAEINAMKNLNLAKEVHEQKLREGQEIGKLVLLAEARLGELFKLMPKAHAGGWATKENLEIPSARKSETTESEEEEPLPKPKLEVAAQMGFNKNQVAQFQKLADNPAAVQKAIATAQDNGEIVTRSTVLTEIKQAEKEAKQEERREQKFYTPPTELQDDSLKLFCTDIRSGLLDIADNSVDFIITDPPYPKEYLPLYEDLSILAARVLKDGGSLICMTGQSYLPEVIQLLSTNMTYHWCLCYSTPGQKTQLWQRHLHTAWKPLLWFIKGVYKGDWLGTDVMTSPNNDKRFHKWGQSSGGMIDIIERITNPNDIILDPFLGGGTTGLAALVCKRKFIGVDIDQKNIDVTKSRIAEEFNNARDRDT